MYQLKTIWKLVVLVGCLLTASQAYAQQDTLKILFVGNSFTYFYNLPQMVAAMGTAEGVHILARQSTVGGSNLEQHWKGEKGTQTMEKLAMDDWDFVVMNNHSLSSIRNPESFMEYGKKFAEKIKEMGAHPVFMMTWAYKSNPMMQEEISRMYKNLAEESGTWYVPCGPMYAMARQLRPDLDLFFDDKHPSANGTYLLALAFYRFFTGKSVADIPDRLTTKDQYGEKLYLVFMEKGNSHFLQQLVDEFDYQLFPSSKK